MNRSHLGTCFVAPILLMVISFALSMHDPSIDPMEIVDSIQQGSRSVLLLATTPLSKRVLVIVSSPGSTVLDDDAIVFDQSLDSLTDTSMQLTYSAQYFKDKWRKLPTSDVDTLGVLHDLDHEYMVVGYSKQLQLLNLAAVEDDVLSKHLNSDQYTRYFGKGRILLSSPHHMHVYSHFIDHRLEGFFDLKFLGSDLVSNKPKQDDDLKLMSSSYLTDFNATGVITFSNTKNPTNFQDDLTDCPWIITAGYLTRSSVNLVDRNTSSIIQFDVSAFSQDGQASVNYTSIPFISYWTFKPQATPPPPAPPTQDPLPPSKAPLFPINPTTLAPPPSTSEHAHNDNLALIITLVVVFIFLVLGALAFFLLRKRCNSGKQAPLSPSEKMDPKRDASQGKLVVANRKSSKRSSQGQSQRKGSVPSRGASKGKVSKRSSGKQSPLIHSSTLGRLASSSKPSPLRRRRSTKRRAASPRHHHRHASLKQPGTIKPRHHSTRKKRTPRPLTDYQKRTQAIAKLLI